MRIHLLNALTKTAPSPPSTFGFTLDGASLDSNTERAEPSTGHEWEDEDDE